MYGNQWQYARYMKCVHAIQEFIALAFMARGPYIGLHIQ